MVAKLYKQKLNTLAAMKIVDKILGKKGAIGLNQIPSVVMILFFVGIVLGVTLYVLQEFMGKMTENTTAYYAVNDTISAVGDFSGWLKIIVIVIAAAIIIGLIMLFRGGKER